MLATAVMAGFGFFFWLINARLFSAANIGVATTLISVMSLIALLSLLGFNNAFVRFLPAAKNRNDQISTGLVLVTITSVFLSILFIVFLRFISPQLAFIQQNLWFAIIFIIACVMNALNTLTDSVFLAGRQTKYTLIINTILSAFKMLVPFAFIGFGAMGIFGAVVLAQILGTVLSILAMMRWFDYRLSLTINWGFVSNIWRYNTANYLSGVLGLLPATLLPIIIINNLGPESAAYYYIAMMVANLLYAIPYAATRSLFAEGSHDEESIQENLMKSIKTIFLLIIPAILVLLAGSGLVLQIFGKSYEGGGADFLRLVVLAGITVSTSSIIGILLQIKKDIGAIIITNFLNTITVIYISYVLLPVFGLNGVGIAWISGGLISTIVGYLLYRMPETYWKHILTAYKKITFEQIAWQIKYLYSKARFGVRGTILCYPQKPRPYHNLHTLCYKLHMSITNNPYGKFDAIVAFDDTTIRKEDAILTELAKDHQVINAHCGDISKTHVEEIFKKVFGYGMSIDPRTYEGEYVQKSDTNALHDGKVLNTPSEPQKGYIYQKLINNISSSAQAVDVRLHIFRSAIPLALYRYKSINDRFDHTLKAEPVDACKAFSKEELAAIFQFCKEFGLDYGELDILRDNNDGKIYIVDVSNTPSGPHRGATLSKKDYDNFMRALSRSFASAFLNSQK